MWGLVPEQMWGRRADLGTGAGADVGQSCRAESEAFRPVPEHARCTGRRWPTPTNAPYPAAAADGHTGYDIQNAPFAEPPRQAAGTTRPRSKYIIPMQAHGIVHGAVAAL